MRLVVTLSFACLVVATFLGCSNEGNNWQGGSDLGGPTAASLLFVQPTDGQVGLRYGERQTLSVRLGRGVGATFQPVVGQEIRFAIAADPKGSALASDRAFTDDFGFATVDLTAGQLEATYTIAVSSTIAPTIEFSVSVSKNQFLDLDVVIAAPTSLTGATARGLLYMDRTCSALEPTTTPPPPLRQLAGVASTSQTLLPFRNLLAQDYALVGRLDDDQGKLLAWRCLDLPLEVVTTAGVPKLVVPLEIVLPALGGRFVLSSTLPSTDDELLPLEPWRALVRCQLDPAEHLYTRLLAALELTAPILAATLATDRKVPSTGGCRPNIASPDQSLAIALGGGPADQLLSVVNDLTTFAGSVYVETELDVQPLTSSQPGVALQYGGTHKARLARLSDANGDPFEIDLLKEGWFVGAVPLSLARDGARIVSTEHTLPLGLPYLWRLALERRSLADRLPDLSSASGAQLVAAVLAQATAPGDLHGCDAIAAIVCDQPSDRPAVIAACESLPASVGAELDAAFVPGASPSLHIEATISDGNDDLVVDTLGPGALRTSDGRVIPITGSLLQ